MISETSKLLRRETIGSSDAAPICGLSPWTTAYDVWCKKTGRIEDSADNQAMHAGTLLESAVLDWAFHRLRPIGMQRDQLATHHEYEWMTANLDATVILDDNRSAIVEAKTSGVTSPLRREEWGEDGSADLPEQYLIQVQHQLAVTGIELAYVPALLPPRGFVLFCVPRMQDVIDALMERASAFRQLVVNDTPPPDSLPTLPVAKMMRRQAGKTIPVDPAIIENWKNQKEIARFQQKAAEVAEAKLLAVMGDAEVGTFPGGIVTYNQTTRKGYTVQETTYRVLRVKNHSLTHEDHE